MKVTPWFALAVPPIRARLAHVAQGGVKVLHRSLVILLVKSPHGPLEPQRAEVEELAGGVAAHGRSIASAPLDANQARRSRPGTHPCQQGRLCNTRVYRIPPHGTGGNVSSFTVS